MSKIVSSIALLILLAPLACVQAPKPVFQKAAELPKDGITFMTYNVENLFDTEDDANKHDETYMPLAKKNEAIKAACRAGNRLDWRQKECMVKDWNESVLDLKMRRLTDVLKQVKGGKGPDVLLVQEVENLNVLEIWRNKYLKEFNYKPALILEGPDERGIDVGIITRLEPVGPVKLHTIPFKENAELKAEKIYPTRGVLEATLKLPDGSLVTVMTVHLPSQANPSEMRRQALDFLDKLKADLPADRAVIIGGDFNVSSDEEAKTGYLTRNAAKKWGVTHVLGCKDCPGTYFYGKNQSWSFFDVFLVSQNLLPTGTAPWKMDPATIRLENRSKYQTGRFEGPVRFSEERKSGVSDHWPLAFELIKR